MVMRSAILLPGKNGAGNAGGSFAGASSPNNGYETGVQINRCACHQSLLDHDATGRSRLTSASMAMDADSVCQGGLGMPMAWQAKFWCEGDRA